jgi:hypothetical protein
MIPLSQLLHPSAECHGTKDTGGIHETSPVIGAASKQGSAPSFRATVRLATPVARILTAVVLMVLVLLIGKATGSPSTDYYGSVEVAR